MGDIGTFLTSGVCLEKVILEGLLLMGISFEMREELMVYITKEFLF